MCLIIRGNLCKNRITLKSILFVFLAFFVIQKISAKEDTLYIQNPEINPELSNYLNVYTDSSNQEKLWEVGLKKELFIPFNPKIKLGKNQTHWGKVEIVNNTDHPNNWAISPDWGLDTKRNSFVDIYFIFSNNPQDTVLKKTGRYLPYSQKDSIAKVFQIIR